MFIFRFYINFIIYFLLLICIYVARSVSSLFASFSQKNKLNFIQLRCDTALMNRFCSFIDIFMHGLITMLSILFDGCTIEISSNTYANTCILHHPVNLFDNHFIYIVFIFDFIYISAVFVRLPSLC